LRPYVNVTFGVVSKLHALNPTVVHAPFFQFLLQTSSPLSFSCSCLPFLFFNYSCCSPLQQLLLQILSFISFSVAIHVVFSFFNCHLSLTCWC
jgi:hypothetical protein